MLAVIAFAVALAAPSAIPPVNRINAPSATVMMRQRPTSRDINEFYPPRAAAAGIGGRAELGCELAAKGHLSDCSVIDDSPGGLGFGAAALRLAQRYRYEGAASFSRVDLPIDFTRIPSEDRLFVQGPWLAAPTFAQTLAAYPEIGGGVAGDVVLRCGLTRDGRLADCNAVFQNPPDRDFDKAALKLAPLFHMALNKRLLDDFQPMVTELRLHLPAPFGPGAGVERISDPQWLAAASPARLAALYPAEAAAKGVKAGEGSADCTIGADGALVDCSAAPEVAQPPGLGFSRAAALAAADYRVGPWTNDGGPVDGARVRLVVRFAAAPR